MSTTRSDWEPSQRFIFFPQVVGAAIAYGAPPSAVTSITVVAGGTIPVGTTTAYRVSIVDAAGNESLAGPEVVASAATSAGNQTTNVTLLRVPSASAYRLYGRTAGVEQFIAQIADPGGTVTTVTYSDTGAITPSGAPPTKAPASFAGRDTRIAYSVIASTTQASAATIKIYVGAAQIGVLVATPTLGTVTWPIPASGTIMPDLWVSTSAAVDITVLTN